ncbi:Long-chain-fatty-acid--[acyl-carrier-protein] ligase AEE15, chloroplastic, partial [Cucurbita argyrosperma subsp. argyrosperma]
MGVAVPFTHGFLPFLVIRSKEALILESLANRREREVGVMEELVPDIWRFSAERYGDRVALLDPYHNPASKITYKQLEQSILNFCEGLRAIGIKPDEKIALFSDNSCRWLVADQALVVDNPELFNRIIETFRSKASMRCIILLWGENSSLAAEGLDGIGHHGYGMRES